MWGLPVSIKGLVIASFSRVSGSVTEMVACHCTKEEKRSFLNLAVKEEYYLFMEHDAHNEIITLKKTEKGIRFGGSLSLKDL